MKRRHVLAGSALLAGMPFMSAAKAQSAGAAGAEDKLPTLMGGDFATATSRLALLHPLKQAVGQA